MVDYGKIISDFLSKKLQTMSEYVYNEFSLQFELAIYLREKINESHLTLLDSAPHADISRVYFEKNVCKIYMEQDEFCKSKKCKMDDGKCQFTKKEIDLSIMQNDILECAIELKYPRNGQYPEEMFKFIEDIEFLEQLRNKGFKSAYAVCLVDDPAFCEKTSPRAKIDGIYGYFRNKITINGSITKPTGDKNKSHTVEGNYCINWEKTGDGRMFYIIQIQLVNSGSSDNGCQNNC